VRGGVHKRRIFHSICQSSYPCEFRFLGTICIQVGLNLF
jgi:hypothetical protein